MGAKLVKQLSVAEINKKRWEEGVQKYNTYS